jgi:hypothetical protein
MQQSSRDPSHGSWGWNIWKGKGKSHYSEGFRRRIVGTRKRAQNWVMEQIRDVGGAREVAVMIFMHDLQSEMPGIFAFIGNDRLCLPGDVYEKIVGKAQEVSSDETEKPLVSETPDLSTTSAFPQEVGSGSDRIACVYDGVSWRAVIPGLQDVVAIICDYPGIYIRTMAQERVTRQGGDPDLDDAAFRKAMGDASAAHKCGYVRRIGDQFYPLDYPLENAA